MISWIQRSFQKHFRWVFALILAAMVIPLIVIFSPSSGVGRGANKLLERPFFGHNLGNEIEARQLFSDGNLSAQLRGYTSLQGAQLQEYALQRAAGLSLADELHLPLPSEAQVAKFVSTLRAFQNEQGQFDQKRYTAFGDSLKAGGQLTVADVNRVLRDDTRLSEVLAGIVGGPGYIMPHDIRQQLIRTDSTWTVQVATLDYATFAPVINPTEDALKKFYEENAARYDVPARPRFSYVEFKGSEYLPTTAPTDAELRAFYNANPEAFPAPAAATPAPAGAPADNFLKVRDKVETALKSNASARLASKAANDLTLALYDQKLTANSPELAAFLASRHLTVVAVAPFAPDFPPADKPWLGACPEQIARLGKDHYFSDPLPTTDSFVVLLWNDSLPAYKPLFTEVRDRVAADFKDTEKRRLFTEQGKVLRVKLQAAAKTPAGFTAAATAEKLEVKTYANFTLRQPPQDLPYSALNSLTRLEAGQVADMTATADKGFITYVQEKKLPDLSPDSPRYIEMKKQLGLFTAGTNRNAYLSWLVERELKKSDASATP
jgi:peptidyl-prolyl cis-trans isomerase D